jgi:hypothetical protein
MALVITEVKGSAISVGENDARLSDETAAIAFTFPPLVAREIAERTGATALHSRGKISDDAALATRRRGSGINGQPFFSKAEAAKGEAWIIDAVRTPRGGMRVANDYRANLSLIAIGTCGDQQMPEHANLVDEKNRWQVRKEDKLAANIEAAQNIDEIKGLCNCSLVIAG